MSIPEALIEEAAKALHADVCCSADGRDGACVYPNDLWGDRHVARIALEAVAAHLWNEGARAGIRCAIECHDLRLPCKYPNPYLLGAGGEPHD